MRRVPIAAGDHEERDDADCLRVAHASKAILFGADQLRGEGKEVVEHRPEEREYGHDDDTQNRVHALTLPEPRNARKWAQ